MLLLEMVLSLGMFPINVFLSVMSMVFTMLGIGS